MRPATHYQFMLSEFEYLNDHLAGLVQIVEDEIAKGHDNAYNKGALSGIHIAKGAVQRRIAAIRQRMEFAESVAEKIVGGEQ